jgi:two-component system, cell cycle response regulator
VKILVADDDALSRSLMRRMLLQSGYEVVTAKDGAEAVKIMQDAEGPRLALLDWMMPELDGPGVCKVIRSSSRRAYVYMTLLTSRGSKEDLVAGLEAGADDYLIKPCHMDELRARLRTGERILGLEDSLVEAREAMRFQATHDALTELLDRGAVVGELAAAIEGARGWRKPLSVVLCDVDHFKTINDTYGHPVGDEVLRETARRLESVVRGGDAVGRYGGEEFLLVLHGCEPSALSSCAQRICDAVRGTPCATSAGPLRVSVSAGAFCLEPGGAEMTPAQLLRKVDDLLYRAKREGRDRAVLGRTQEHDSALQFAATA